MKHTFGELFIIGLLRTCVLCHVLSSTYNLYGSVEYSNVNDDWVKLIWKY